jgi:hypothetical protein
MPRRIVFVGVLAAGLLATVPDRGIAQVLDEANVVLTTGTPTSGVLVLDDADRNFQGQPFYEDNLSCIGVEKEKTFRVSGLNNCQTIGSNHQLAFDADRGWIWIIESVAHRLTKFDRSGKQLLTVEGLKASALAVDPASGNVWVLTSNGDIHGEGLVTFDGAAKRLAEYPVSGFDIAYDGKSKSFWIASSNLLKVRVADGKVLLDRPIAEWCASCIAIHQTSGKVWVGVRKHTDVAASKSELLAFNNDGTPAAVIPLPEKHPFHVAVDEESGSVWLTALRDSVMKFSSAGTLEAEHKIEALTAEVDRATRDLWVVTSQGVTRLTGTGKVIEHIEFPKPTGQAWIAPL